jgi:cysteine desulfurase
MDYAATTALRKEVFAEMEPYFSKNYGNPSSLYGFASESRNAIEISRDQVSKILKCRRSEIVFTSGGTESNNMAIKGVALKGNNVGHIVTTATEHHANLNSFIQLNELGWDTTVIGVNTDGTVDPYLVKDALRPETKLVSVMYVNNETGAVNDIQAISTIVKSSAENVLIHTDAVQAAGKLNLDVNKLGVDMLSISGHKIHAPKGIGILYVKKGTDLSPLMTGGGQERSLRSGTENVPSIVGLGVAITLAERERLSLYSTMVELQKKLIHGVKKIAPGSILNGDLNSKIPSIVNFSFSGFQGEPLILGLDFKGILASSGSACSSASVEPSHVLMAMGLSRDEAVGSVRFSMGQETTENDVDRTINALGEVLNQLGSMST